MADTAAAAGSEVLSSSGSGNGSSSDRPLVPFAGRFGSSPRILGVRPLESSPSLSHNCLQEKLDWDKVDCSDFLRLAKDVPVEDLMECIITDKLYSKTGERSWDLTEYVLQRKDRRMFIGGQGLVLFVRRQGHTASLAMKVCYHRRDEKKVERNVQRTILHLKAQSASPFVGKILVNYLTRRFFVTIMPKAKFASLKAMKKDMGQLSDESIQYYFACITSALVKMHSVQICHRDIKCDNVLVMHNGIPVLIDFGLAVKAAQSMDQYRQGSRMTQMQYYPPESRIIGSPINDYKIDSWLLGFFLCEMLLPDRDHLWSKFKNCSEKDWEFTFCSLCKVPPNSQVVHTVARLLAANPLDRCFVNQVPDMPYLRDSGRYSDIETAEPPGLKFNNSENSDYENTE